MNAEEFLRTKYKLVDFAGLTINGAKWTDLMEEFASRDIEDAVDKPLLNIKVINNQLRTAVERAIPLMENMAAYAPQELKLKTLEAIRWFEEMLLLHKDQNHEECDARNDDSNSTAG